MNKERKLEMNNQTERFGAERRALFRQAVEDLFKDSRMARVVHIGGISDDVYEIHFRNPVLTKIYLLGVKINTVPSDPDRRNVPEFRISYNMIIDSLSANEELHLLKQHTLVDLSTDEGIWEALEVLKRISNIVRNHEGKDVDSNQSTSSIKVEDTDLSELYPEKITLKEKDEMFSNYLTNLSD